MNDNSNQVPSEMSINDKTGIEKEVDPITMKDDDENTQKLQTTNEQKRMAQDPPAPCITETDTTSFSDTDYDIENSSSCNDDNDDNDDTDENDKLRQKFDSTSNGITITEAIDNTSTDYTKTTTTTTVPRSLLIILSGICLAMVLIITITYTLYLKNTDDTSSITDQQNASQNVGSSAPTPTPPVQFDAASDNNDTNNNGASNNSDSPVNPINLCGIQYPPIQPLPGKKGLGTVLKQGTYNANIEKIQSLEPSWYYDWGLEPIPYSIRSRHNFKTKFVPMIWGKSRSNDELRQKIINAEIPQMIANGTVTQVLGFNEPDGDLQANMTVAEAIERWTVLQELNVSLVSPAPKTPLGEWFVEFMKIAQEKCLRIDSIAVHWYGPPNITLFQNRMRLFYQLYKLPISLTEFAVADWDLFTRDPTVTLQTLPRQNKHNKPQVLQFMKQAITWLEETEWILSYAWFMFENDSNHGWPSALFTQNNNLTTIGQYYKSITVDNVYGNMSINYPM